METVLHAGDGCGNKLYLMRGLPGSGKSTLARAIGGCIFSTDDFYMVDGVYRYDPARAGEAHAWNRQRTHDALSRAEPTVVIDNTNVRAWEMRPYAEMGLAFGYMLLVAEPETPYHFDVAELARRNTHGVSEAIISRLKDSWVHDVTLDDILSAEPPVRKQK